MVTGKTYTGSTITVDAPNNQGQVRVLVKDWTGGKLIDDGAFIYETAAQHKGGQDYDGNQEAGTTWVDETPLQPVSVSLSPAGGSFRTNTVTVTAEALRRCFVWLVPDRGTEQGRFDPW